MKVVHIVPAAFSRDGVIGGAERYAHELARNMASVVPTALVTFGPRSSIEMQDGLEVRVIGDPWYVRGQRSNPFSLRLFSALRDATVIHCHQQHVVASTAAAAYARITGRRVFVSDLGGGGWDLSAYTSTDRWYHGHLHISRYSRRIFGHEANPRAHVILGGVDTDRFSPAPSPGTRKTVVFVGRLLPHKGVNYLIEGLPAGIALEIIGRAADESYLAELERLAVGKDVVFRRDFDDAALVEAYRRAMCVVLPSVYRTSRGDETRVPELLGQTLLEGMSCGIPAIGTSVASLPEVVEDTVTGFLVPPNNPEALGHFIQLLAREPAHAAAMGQAARARVLRYFRWSTVVERCLDFYSR